MPKIIFWMLIASCLLGQILVTKSFRIGYMLWIIADGIWAIFNFSQYKVPGAIEQGVLWTLYFVISLWGWLIFKKQYKRNCWSCRYYDTRYGDCRSTKSGHYGDEIIDMNRTMDTETSGGCSGWEKR